MTFDTSDNIGLMFKKIQTWSLAVGIAMIIIGLLTSTFAMFTTFFTIIFLGIVLAARGVADIISAFMPHHYKGLLWHLFGGILSIAIGVLIVTRPGITAAVFTYLIAAFLIILGLFKTIAAPIEHEANWGWMMLSGIISLAFGIWIIGVWPAISLWLIGLLIGIEILVQGIVMIRLPYAIPHTRRGRDEIYAH
jgi:uncharacterized membrane protein HdeD (DUF308 family)